MSACTNAMAYLAIWMSEMMMYFGGWRAKVLCQIKINYIQNDNNHIFPSICENKLKNNLKEEGTRVY